MMKLTKNEKLCFYGLIKYPILNDKQLSEKINIKRSTITAIRNKLKKNGFFETINIPNFNLLGCELLSVVYGTLNCREHEFQEEFESFKNNPNITYSYFTSTKFFIGFIEKNYTDFSKHSDKILEQLEMKKYIKKFDIVHFPLETSLFARFTDFSYIIKDLFQIDMPDESHHIIPKKYKLSNKEKIILTALIKYPEATDTFIAEKINVARPTISSTKNTLINNGLLHIINIPNLQKMPFEILSLNHARFNYKFRDFIKNDGLKKCPNNSHNFLMVCNARNSLAINVYREYTTYRNNYKLMIEQMTAKDFFTEEPEKILISLKDSCSRKLDFSELTKKMLLGEK